MIPTTAIATTKSTGLTKTGEGVRFLASRLERARQSRNEKVARADAEYVDAVRRALTAVDGAGDDPTTTTTKPAAADGAAVTQ
jgi:hypothetical protein